MFSRSSACHSLVQNPLSSCTPLTPSNDRKPGPALQNASIRSLKRHRYKLNRVALSYTPNPWYPLSNLASFSYVRQPWNTVHTVSIILRCAFRSGDGRPGEAGRPVCRIRTELPQLTFQLTNAHLQHLILSCEHLCLSLVECAFVSTCGWS